MSSFEQKPGSAPTPANTQSVATQGPSVTTQGPSVTTNNSTYRLPTDITFQHASKLAIVEDKPIMLTYWSESFDKSVCIMCNKGSGEKVIYKDSESYTSPIVKSYKNVEDYILMTENSIYIVVANIPVKSQ